MYCKNCGEPMNDSQAICLRCGVKRNVGNAFCPNCGKPVAEKAAVCLNCGITLEAGSGELAGQSKETMAILCFLLGGIGVHNFVMGETKKGIFKICATLCFGIGEILMLIDFVKILTGKYEVDPSKLL